MTNQEYEAASIAAAGAADFFEGEHKLQQCDKAITVLEEAITRLQEERREIVNFYNLNKCKTFGSHAWLPLNPNCIHCGKTLREAEEYHFGAQP
ncbi:TPA: hypothetical protein ACXHW4_004255 [Enterobacter hormaechei]